MSKKPCFRTDLVAKREEEQGIVYYQVEDPLTKSKSRLYEMEYMIAQQMDGQKGFEEIIKLVNDELHFALTKDDLTRFISQLDSMNFLTHLDDDSAAHEPETVDVLIEPSIDPAEEERLLTSAILQIKQGFFDQAKDYFLELKEASPGDQRHLTMLGHLSILGSEPTGGELKFIWNEVTKIYPQIAAAVGTPETTIETAEYKQPVAQKNGSKTKIYILLAIIIALILAGGAYYFFACKQKKAEVAPLTVSTRIIESYTAPLFNEEWPAKITAIQKSALSFGENGQVEALEVAPEAKVEKGAFLAALTMDEALKRPFAEAKNKLVISQKDLAKISAANERNEERLSALNEKKAKDLAKIKELSAGRSSKNRASVQKIKKELSKTNKNLAAGQKLKVKLADDLNQAKKREYAAQKEFDTLVSGADYKNKVLTAPISGLIEKIAIAPGQEAANPALTIIDPTLLRASFKLPEELLKEYTPGQGVALLIKEETDFKKISAVVEKVEDNELAVKIQDITETLYKESRPLFLELATKEELYIIPQKLLLGQKNKTYLWVSGEDKQAHQVAVKVLAKNGDNVIISGKLNTSLNLIESVKNGSLADLDENIPLSPLP